MKRPYHPLVRAFAKNARKEGAAVVTGVTYATAHWPDDTIREVRVNRRKRKRKAPTKQ